MATMDQLPADKRAIIELVLRRGRSYGQLSELLELPEARVREHARDALAALAPRSAERVDAQWRDQVADYVLGQQTGPQAKATRSHLKTSEGARTWALSVLDSVGHLYPAGAEPDVPARGGRGAEERVLPHRGAGGRDAAVAPAQGRAGAASGEGRAPEAEGTSPAGAGGSAATASGGRGGTAPTEPGWPSEGGRSPSPGTSTPRRRRRIVAASAGVVVVASVVVVLVTGAFGGDDDSADSDSSGADAAAAGSGESEVVAQLLLRPVGDTRGAAGAIIAEQAGQPVMLLQGRLPQIGRDQAYVVWLYNDPRDALAVAVPQVDRQGTLQTLAPLPPDWERFRSVDVSLQDRNDRTRHSGDSVLRAPLERAAPGATEP